VSAKTDGSFLLADTGGVYAFLGPTCTVTIAAGQKIYVVSNAGLGSTAVGGATMDRLSVGYRVAGSGLAPSDQDADYIIGVRVPQNSRIPMTLSTTITGLAAGTYEVGMIYRATAAQVLTWNSNDWSRTQAIVLQN
jgi:hypothetical protein